MLFLVSFLLLGTAVLGQLPVHHSEAPGRLQTRIVGGEFIPVQHVPHQAFLITSFKSTPISTCGAILIAPEWLLTAEHCLENSDLNEYPIDVFLGVSRLEQIDSKQKQEGMVKRRVVRYFRGPWVEIGNRTQYSDIMLLKLDKKVTTSGKIKPIELPAEGARFTNQTAVASGFGRIHHDAQHRSNTEPFTRTLQYTKVPILSKNHCLAMLRERADYQEFRLKIAPESTLCAGNAEGGHNVCLGDSGGPLAVCATPLRETPGERLLCEDNRWLLAGVTSLSVNIHDGADIYCALPNRPAFYVNVRVFSEWIRRTIRNNCSIIMSQTCVNR